MVESVRRLRVVAVGFDMHGPSREKFLVAICQSSIAGQRTLYRISNSNDMSSPQLSLPMRMDKES